MGVVLFRNFSRRETIKKTEIMKLSITLIALVGSLLCISPIFGEDNVQCKSNQECIKLRDCPYTKNLLTRVLSSSDRAEKNNMISEMRELVCKPSDRSVCCDIEESEAEAEAEGDHEDSEAEAEGSSHDDQNEITDTIVSHDFPYKVGDISELSEHELAGELWATDKNTLEFRKFTYEGDGPDAFFMIGTHDADEKPNLDDGIPIPYSKDEVFIQKLYDINDEIPALPEFKNEQFKITLPPGIHVSDLKWLSVYCRKFTKDFGNVKF